MEPTIPHTLFKYMIKRKTPCLISILDIGDPININIHNNLYNIRKEFPLVLFYRISMRDYRKYHLSKNIYGPNNVIYFQENNIKAVVDGTNFNDVYKLAWRIYIDSCINNAEGLIQVLVCENRIPRNSRYYPGKEDEINILAMHENGLISTYLDQEYSFYPSPKFLERNRPRDSYIKGNHINLKRKSKYRMGIKIDGGRYDKQILNEMNTFPKIIKDNFNITSNRGNLITERGNSCMSPQTTDLIFKKFNLK